jgi:hypothetical protein
MWAKPSRDLTPMAIRIDASRRRRANYNAVQQELAFIRLYSLDLSRRKMSQGAALASAGAAVVATLGGPVAAKGWKSKASVALQDSPPGHERREICAPFLPPDRSAGRGA